MSVQTGRVVSAEEAREYQANEGQANGDINDLAHTVVVQAEQIADLQAKLADADLEIRYLVLGADL
jgi:hypothetical protein